MLTFLADSAATVVVPLRINGEPFIPDALSVKWTLRDAAGVIVPAYENQNVTMAVGGTEAVVTVPADENGIGAGRFSKRTVVVTCTKSARPLTFTVTYRLTPYLNTTVTAEKVRAFIGVDAGEVPDEKIDVVAAYFDVEDDVSQARLDAALSASDRRERLANDAILARAVLNLMPALPQLLAQVESNGVFTIERQRIDFEKIEERAMALYAGAVDSLSSRLEEQYEFLHVVPTVDPITGV